MATIFDLRNPLIYSNKFGVSGQVAHDLELIAPCYDQRVYSRNLKQVVQAAIKKTSQEDDLYRVKMLAASHISISETAEFKEQTKEIETPEESKTELEKRRDKEADIEWMRKTLLEGIPLGKYAEALEEFAKNASFLVKVDDDIFLTDFLVKQVDETELEEIFASYCLNFTVPCLL